MNETNSQPDFFKELQTELKELWQSARDGWNQAGVSFRNGTRKLRGAEVDYVVLKISGSLPERAEPPRTFIERQLRLPPPPFSIEQLNNRLQRIQDADNVKGVLFVLGGLSAGSASLQNVRQSLLRLREKGKEVIVFTPYLDAAHYLLASAADTIVIPPGTTFEVIGLRLEAVFLKDALERVGLQADAVQISPYKSGPNFLARSDITPEQKEQLEWLLEETFDILTAAMADGRHMTQAEFKQVIDDAPLFAGEALKAGLVDMIAYEDGLAYLLAKAETIAETSETEEVAEDEVEGDPAPDHEDPANDQAEDRPKAKLMRWSRAQNLLFEKSRRFSRKFIGVISLQGTINMGNSQQPPIDLPLPFIGGKVAGEATLLSLIRRAEKMEEMAALIFHIDSPGGSGLASDLIGREIQRLSQKKPVVVYMGNVAASGGYYVSAAARHIVSQTLSMTGSIGVWTIRLSTGGLYEKLSVNRASVERGKRANLYGDSAPMTEEEYQIFLAAITEMYRQFKDVVANGRNIPFDDLDPICEGRVWSGRQAREHKLVDSHGDFLTAVKVAAELAELPFDDTHRIPVLNLYPKGSPHLIPRPYEAAEEMARLISGERLQGWNGRPLYLMPFQIRFY